MTTGARYKRQRSNRVRLKADAAFLLREIIKGEHELPVVLLDEIKEMQVRLNPQRGVAAPIILTGFTKESK